MGRHPHRPFFAPGVANLLTTGHPPSCPWARREGVHWGQDRGGRGDPGRRMATTAPVGGIDVEEGIPMAQPQAAPVMPPVDPAMTPYRLEIDQDGIWTYNGAPLIHPKGLALFKDHLQREADGSYFVAFGPQRGPVAV